MSQNKSDQSFGSEEGDDGSLGGESEHEEDEAQPKKKAVSGKKGLATKNAVTGVGKNPAKQPTKRGRKKRPKDMPQRPLSAYNLFFRQEREIIIKRNTLEEIIKAAEASRGLDANPKSDKRINLFQALAVLISKKWKSLDSKERKVYEDMAQQEMAAYRKKLGDYQIQLVRKSLNATGDDNKKKNDNLGIESTESLKLPPSKPSLPSAAAAPMSDSFLDPSQVVGNVNYDALLGRPPNSHVFGTGGNSGATMSGAGMFPTSFQAQLNNNLARAPQQASAESSPAAIALSAADLQKWLIQTSGASFQPGSGHAADALAQLARQQQNAYCSAADSFIRGQLQHGFTSAYGQDLIFAQQQQNLLGGLAPPFGVQSQHLAQQQGDFLQWLQALQQTAPRNTLPAAGLDPATMSLYGFMPAPNPSMGVCGPSPELQAFLQQQQQQQQGSSNLGLSTSQRSRNAVVGQANWSSLPGGGGDPSVLATMAPAPTMMSYLPPSNYTT